MDQNLQSTNWQTLRFKPPPPNSSIGWRVEFRSMEVQITDFENAAFSVFVVLLSRAILSFNLNFYIPISKVAVNKILTAIVLMDLSRWTRTCIALNLGMPHALANFISENKFYLQVIRHQLRARRRHLAIVHQQIAQTAVGFEGKTPRCEIASLLSHVQLMEAVGAL